MGQLVRSFIYFMTFIGGFACAIAFGQSQVFTASLPLNVPKSIETNNFAAITPHGPAETWPLYIYTWPGLDISKSVVDSNGNYIPAFDTKTQGIGLWWYWLMDRAGMINREITTLEDVAMKMAGFSDLRHSSVKNYLKAYKFYWQSYSGQEPKKRHPINLYDPDQIELLSKVMFHHEAGKDAKITKLELMEGIALADMILGREKSFATSVDWYLATSVKKKPQLPFSLEQPLPETVMTYVPSPKPNIK